MEKDKSFINPVARNTTEQALYKALAIINKKYSGNVIFNRKPDPVGKAFRFTLKVKNSRGKGAKIGFTGRRTPHACWHVHGDFFDALIKLSPKSVITSAGHKVSSSGGNWQDWNIGSMASPKMFSESCDCKNIKNPCGKKKHSRWYYIQKAKIKRLKKIRVVSKRKNPVKKPVKIYKYCLSINPISPHFSRHNSASIYGLSNGSILIKGNKPIKISRIIPGKNDTIKNIVANKGRALNLPGLAPISASDTFIHKFTNKPKLYRLKDGGLLIKGSKPLWKIFNYKGD